MKLQLNIYNEDAGTYELVTFSKRFIKQALIQYIKQLKPTPIVRTRLNLIITHIDNNNEVGA